MLHLYPDATTSLTIIYPEIHLNDPYHTYIKITPDKIYILWWGHENLDYDLEDPDCFKDIIADITHDSSWRRLLRSKRGASP